MRIVFEGDSITDCGRDRSDSHSLGQGYAYYATAEIRRRHPTADLDVQNFGYSGWQTCNLREVWKEICTDQAPDFVSILIGINDTWHRADSREWLSDAQFEENYRYLLDEIKHKTNAKILLLEQFLLPAEDKEFFREDLAPKIEITRKLAREYADGYLPLDGIFAAACVEKDSLYWSEDGVHPNDNGSALIGYHYANAFDRIMKI